MPASEADLALDPAPETLTELPFPPLTKSHVLNCSYHAWYSKFRALTPKARLIPLSPAFVAYLRADGIVLPDDDDMQVTRDDEDEIRRFETNENDSDDEVADVSADWHDVHDSVRSTIAELGGQVAPKLNWSAPKDATWINATNSMDCRTPNDVYLLLKSSDFITHDLEHAFDDCTDAHETTEQVDIPFHLVLRKHIMVNPSVEFRCFVRRRVLLGICQRDLNHFDFLFDMQDLLRDRIQEFFEQKLRETFPEQNFVFDVYIPAPHQRVWLIDVNPWAQRTDPLLFSWLELLTMPEPTQSSIDAGMAQFVRLSLSGIQDTDADYDASKGINVESDDEVEAEYPRPELRLIRKDDPEAYSFSTPQYSAHKLPRDVVDASTGGVGPLREFADQWKEVLERRRGEDVTFDSDEDD